MDSKLVLLISEDVEYLNVFQNRLRNLNCYFDSLSNIREFDSKKYEKKPHVIIYNLLNDGEIDCFCAIEYIKNKLKLDAFIIIFSEVEDASVVAHSLELGASEYLCRPFFKDSFVNVITKYINGEKASKLELNFSRIHANAQAIKLIEKINIHEVNFNGFVFFSENLIAKGASFSFSHQIVDEIFSKHSIFVTVTKNESYIKNQKNGFLITTEIDNFDQYKMDHLRHWIIQSRGRS